MNKTLTDMPMPPMPEPSNADMMADMAMWM